MKSAQDIADFIAEAVKAKIGGKVSYSSQSMSTYLEVDVDTEFDADGDATECEMWCLRISDHDARTYNRCGNYSVRIGGQLGPDDHEWIKAEWVQDEVEVEIECDGVTITEIEMVDRFNFDADAIQPAIDAAVSAFEKFKAHVIAK